MKGYMLIAEGGDRIPTHIHSTIESAIKEAHRLNSYKKHPKVTILKIVGTIEKTIKEVPVVEKKEVVEVNIDKSELNDDFPLKNQ